MREYVIPPWTAHRNIALDGWNRCVATWRMCGEPEPRPLTGTEPVATTRWEALTGLNGPDLVAEGR